MLRPALALALTLPIGACSRPADPVDVAAAVHRVEAGDTVRLRVGESVELGATGARLTVRGVPADSRCPTDVTCVWAGDAQVRVDAVARSGTAGTLDLHTTLDPKESLFDGWRIRLVDVAPGRVQQGSLRQQDYSVRLAISRG